MGGGWLRHTALGWGVRTPWTTPADGGSHGAAPPWNLVSGVASGHPSTDSSGAGGQEAPGLQVPPATHHAGRGTRGSTAEAALHRGPRPNAGRRGGRRPPTGDWCRAYSNTTHQAQVGGRAGKEDPPDHYSGGEPHDAVGGGRGDQRHGGGRSFNQDQRSEWRGRHCLPPLHIPSDLCRGNVCRKTVPLHNSD